MSKLEQKNRFGDQDDRENLQDVLALGGAMAIIGLVLIVGVIFGNTAN